MYIMPSSDSESFSLFLNSFGGSPYITQRNSVVDVIYTINWDTIFNLNNRRYRKCKLRHDFYSDAISQNTVITPTADNGLLVLNGIISKSSSSQGGMVLGEITLDTISTTNNIYANPSIVANNFVGSITGGTNTVTISSSASPLFILALNDTITFYDPNTSANTTRTITAQTSAYAYTFSGAALGATGITSKPFSSSNPFTVTYNCLKSTSLQNVKGIEIVVPRGMTQLEVQLQANNYGQAIAGGTLLIGTYLSDWALMLNFELYDPEPNEYNL